MNRYIYNLEYFLFPTSQRFVMNGVPNYITLITLEVVAICLFVVRQIKILRNSAIDHCSERDGMRINHCVYRLKIRFIRVHTRVRACTHIHTHTYKEYIRTYSNNIYIE